jgi:hypothetical protein
MRRIDELHLDFPFMDSRMLRRPLVARIDGGVDLIPPCPLPRLTWTV